MKPFDRKLILEDGSQYFGYGFGSRQERITELVFNTSPVGYQEIVSDPSYAGQTVVMAYPMIGCYGIAAEDFETQRPVIGGLAVREYQDSPSNFRCICTLGELMENYEIPGISGIDTRRLVRAIRTKGSGKVLMTAADTPLEEGLERLGRGTLLQNPVARIGRKIPECFPAAQERFRVAAIDCGMKQNIVRCLNRRGCSVTALPWNTTAKEVEALCPDGILLSNGPGNPEEAEPVIRLVQALRGKYPMFGICLGHQILCLACGARTYPLKFGHRGGNHPVKNLKTGKIEITSQNHSYAVDAGSLAGTGLKLTHINLLDHTVEGAACAADGLFGVQYHPESAPGPQDSAYLIDLFIRRMEDKKNAEKN